MKSKLVLLLLGMMLMSPFGDRGWAQDEFRELGVMRPDRETRLEWFQLYENAPKAYIDKALQDSMPLKGSYNVINNLSYIPAERNQGACGNCWAWAGTGVMEVELNRQDGIYDRLSLQYINSCEGSVLGKTCCAGGWLADVADFYTLQGSAIPWNNPGAVWQDGDASCDTSCASVDTTPNYPIASINETSIVTTGVTQATAIANIKNILHQGKAVWWAFYMPTSTDGNTFKTWWNTQPETAVWNPDFVCGHTWSTGGWGHAVLIVGYNDNDPDNPYWIVVNSWGTASGGRPNGIFRLDMDMNYGCIIYDDGDWFWGNYFQTLNMDYNSPAEFNGDPCCNTGGIGCVDEEIETAVCAVDSYCCNSTWDSICVNEVTSVFGDTCECCESHSNSTGCYDFSSSLPEAVSDCVCAMDSYCCQYRWDTLCANEAKDYCGACEECLPPPTPVNPVPANGAVNRSIDTILSWNGGVTSTPIEKRILPSFSATDVGSGVLDLSTVVKAENNGFNNDKVLLAENSEKTGLPVLGLAVDCACDGQYATGTPVVALVDNPSGKSDVFAGDTGTVVCGKATGLTILVSWDNITTGHDGNGLCECPEGASVPDNSGWWVSCAEIGLNEAPCPVTYDVYFGTTGPSDLICSDVSSPTCDPGTLAYDTTYYWQVVAKGPSGNTAGPVWSFTTTSSHPCCNQGGPGCIDESIKAAVCAADSYCCNYNWDSLCVSEVTSVFGDSCECCESHSESEGCYEASSSLPEAVSDCVIAMDSYCGYAKWDNLCAQEAKDYCGGCAECLPPPEPVNPNPVSGSANKSIDSILTWNGLTQPTSTLRSETTAAASVTVAGIADSAAIADLNTPENDLITESSEKTGLPVLGLAVDCVCDGLYATGTPVVALVDNPSGKSDIYAGDTGTVVCGGDGLPPILVSWDNLTTGHDGNGYCACPAEASVPDNSGWYVECEEIGLNEAPCPVIYDVYFGITGPSNLICSDVSSPACDPGTLAYGTTYYWQVVAKGPSGATVGPVWSFTTTSSHPCCNQGGPGCIDESIKAAVCAVDPYCCNTAWDGLCVNEVTSVFGDSCECCESHAQSEGCFDAILTYPDSEAVSDCVIAMDAYCGSVVWDSICVVEARDFCGGGCVESCACDLDQDGDCDGSDWFLFSGDWGTCTPTTSCSCDLDLDGDCDGSDWFLFSGDWGRDDCPAAPEPRRCEPQVCGEYTFDCNPDNPGCVCWLTAEGLGSCGPDFPCSGAQDCSTSAECPDGYACMVQTCCGVGKCQPDNVCAAPGAIVQEMSVSGGMTASGR